MRLLVLNFSLLVLALLVFAPVQTTDAAQVASVEILSYFDSIYRDCGQTPYNSNVFSFEVRLSNVVFDTEDRIFVDQGPPSFGNPVAVDSFWVIVYDAYGNPITGNDVLNSVGRNRNFITVNTNAYPVISGWVAAQARPFIAKVYDIDSSNPIPSNVWDVIASTELAVSEPYYPPSDARGRCSQLPIGDPYNFIVNPSSLPDITSETGISAGASELAIYSSDSGDGLDLYGINDENDGFYLGTVTQDMIAPYADHPPEENTLIESFGDNVNVYVLTTGEIQINVGPNEEGKTFVYIFDGIPWTSIATYVIDPPVPE